jgi:hypothetical protein
VNAVNDAPSFVGGPDQTVAEDSGAQVVAGWATAMSAGPANEASQALSFEVMSDNAGLFSVQPAVSTDGTLTYTPALNANGVANVTVVLKDDGGTAGGGVDASVLQSFVITLTPVKDRPVATGQSVTMNEDEVLTGFVSGTDADGDELTYFQVGMGPFNGTVSVASNGAFTYTPNPDFFGTDSFRFRANDGEKSSIMGAVRITVNAVENLDASGAPVEDIVAGPVLSYEQLGVMVDEAVRRWEESGEVSQADLTKLDKVTFQIVDLSGLTLGQASPDTVVIDVNAAGYGWYVDATPADDLEFGLELGEWELMAVETSPAFGRMDLLTVVMHELGHVLGYEDLDPGAHNLMSGALDAGVRRLLDGESDQTSPEAGGRQSLVSLGRMPQSDDSEKPSDRKGIKVQNSWLMEFLIEGGVRQYNPFEPTEGIKIWIPGINGGRTKKKLG